MPKRELSKCREWERERRERLKTCFDALARLLPSHDPTITPSKLEILQRAAAHITDLQQKNKELLLGDQRSTAVAQRDEVRRLRERVRKLNGRTEQLAGLLRTAGLKIPKECIGRAQNISGAFKGPPKLWSGRLSREKAETLLRKEHENDLKTPEEAKQATKRKRKRLSSLPSKTSCSENNIPPSIKKRKPNSKTPRKKKQPISVSSPASLASKVATVLGPGTLILANGSVVPVPPPSGTLHRIQIVPTVNQSKVILMQNTELVKTVVTTKTTNSTSSICNKLPVLRPKTVGSKQNLLAKAKVAIPALVKKKNAPKKTTVSNATKTVETSVNTKEKSDEVSSKDNTDKPDSKTEDSTIVHKKTEVMKKTDDDSTEPQPQKEPVAEQFGSNRSEPTQLDNYKPLLNSKPDNETLLDLPETTTQHQEHSELSNDIFASLGGAGDTGAMIGAQHTESMSPTAAFLLAFPLVSTLTGNRISENTTVATTTTNTTTVMSNNSHNNNNETDRQSTTPTTLLQIGGTMNLDNKNSSTRVLQITDPIHVEKNVTQSRNVDNYDYFRDLSSNQNRYDKEPLISSVLQVSHACLYEQRTTTTNNFYNHSYTTEIHQQQDNYSHNTNNTSKENVKPSKTNNFYNHSYTTEIHQQQDNYPHNTNNTNNTNNTSKEKLSKSHKSQQQQQQRPPVNWMTTPDPRGSFSNCEPQVTAVTASCSSITSDYFLPPFSDVYSGINSTTTTTTTTTAISADNHESWNSTVNSTVNSTNRTVLPTFTVYSGVNSSSTTTTTTTTAISADNHESWNSTVNSTNRTVLPTLLGDLALGVNTASKTTTTNNQYYNPFDINTNKEPSSGFLSVSSILVAKPSTNSTKRQPNNNNHHSKQRHKIKTKSCDGHLTTYDEQNKKYGGGYSAEELIGEYHGRSCNYNLEQQMYRGPNQQQQHRQNYEKQQQQEHRQNYQKQQQYPQHGGEFTALLNAAVADSYKTFDGFKPNTTAGYDSYCSGGPHYNRTHTSDHLDRRRHRKQQNANGTTTNTTGGFSELSFLSMSGAISSPILPDDFHAGATFLPNAPPPLPTPVPSSLTNFNLSAIFPEINKGVTTSSSAPAPMWPHNKHPIARSQSHEHVQQLPEGGKPSGGFCHPPQQLSHDGIFGSTGSFLSHHHHHHHQMQSDVTSAPTNFSFSFNP